MFPEAPGIVQAGLIATSAAEDDYHAIGVALSADDGAVIGPGHGRLIAVNFLPAERWFLDIEDPDVIYGFTAGVAPENDKMGSVVGDRVSVAFAGRASLG